MSQTPEKPKHPKTGDMVLVCAHPLAMKKAVFHAPDGITYTRKKDGSTHTVHWLTCCLKCAEEAGRDPSKIKWATDGQWVEAKDSIGEWSEANNNTLRN